MEKWAALLPDLRTCVGASIIGLFGVTLLIMLTRPMPMTEAIGNLLLVLVGMLSTMAGTIVNYYFGSSKEDDAKRRQTTV